MDNKQLDRMAKIIENGRKDCFDCIYRQTYNNQFEFCEIHYMAINNYTQVCKLFERRTK